MAKTVYTGSMAPRKPEMKSRNLQLLSAKSKDIVWEYLQNEIFLLYIPFFSRRQRRFEISVGLYEYPRGQVNFCGTVSAVSITLRKPFQRGQLPH
jgi:hypothetical protein